MSWLLRNIELAAAVIGACVMLAGVLLVSAPWWASVLVGLFVFAGIWLLGSSQDMRIKGEAAGLSQQDMLRRIKQARKKVVAIQDLAGGVPDQDVRARLLRVCSLSDRIFKNFEDDPDDIAKASRFLLYLDRFLPLIEKYARLSATPQGRELLKKSGDDEEFKELLRVVEEGFAKGFQNYLQNDVVELRTFGRVLKKMIHVAEIGK